jgi:F-type H+-transporting ATPase subunit delta
MARARTSARRYAEAAYAIALRDDAVESWLADLRVAAGALGGGEPAQLLASPVIPVTARLEAVEATLRGRVSDKVRNLVSLLVRRGRIDQLTAVVAEFQRLRDARAGIVQATVTSAAPLTDADVAALRDRLTGMTSGTVEIRTRVDPTLLGGVTVRLGDRLIDGSVRGRLDRLRSRLASGTL